VKPDSSRNAGKLLSERVPRARIHRPEDVYPVDEWNMVEQRFSPHFLAQMETIFALSNGYLGFRGDFEEGQPVVQGGVFLNGFYETWPIIYAEPAFGFAKVGQTIVNATDAKIIRLYVDDELFEIERAEIRSFSRRLDMKNGTLVREISWEDPSGKRIAMKSTRFVSFKHRHLAGISYELTVQNDAAHIVLASELATRRAAQGDDEDPRHGHQFDGRVLEPLLARARQARVLLCHETRSSKIALACGIDHVIDAKQIYRSDSECEDHAGRAVFSVEAGRGERVRLTKYMAYHFADNAPAEELCARAERTLDRALDTGFERLLEEQREIMEDFWHKSDVQVSGDPATQQDIRFNLFQLFQATARAEGHGVPAKGLTGQGYEGHYFWDAEAYVLPFVVHTAPRAARNLLRFRYRLLDKARERARLLSHRGALYPWRTINGEEVSAYYAAGTAQYHINADIAHAVVKYVEVTGDVEFLCEMGAEMIVETARLWADLGDYAEERGGAFCLNDVTGPDEYTAIVNNNFYTNLMAQENLRIAARTVEFLREKAPGHFERLVEATSLDPSEIDEWRRAADAMYVPFDERLGIHAQDDSFLEKKRWDFTKTPAESYPLLLHYHPLTLYRHQVIKQADVVMAMFLLGQDSSLEQKKRNFDYYDPLTTRDSSLSSCIQSIVAAEIGYDELAFAYFMDALTVDLADVGGNVMDGVHIASAGGVWMALIHGFAGMRHHDGVLSFRPRLPASWSSLRFALRVRGQRLEVEIERESVRYTLRGPEELKIRHGDREVSLTPDRPTSLPGVER